MVREMLEKAKQAVLKTGTAGLVLYVEEMQVSHAKCEFLNVKKRTSLFMLVAFITVQNVTMRCPHEISKQLAP